MRPAPTGRSAVRYSRRAHDGEQVVRSHARMASGRERNQQGLSYADETGEPHRPAGCARLPGLQLPGPGPHMAGHRRPVRRRPLRRLPQDENDHAAARSSRSATTASRTCPILAALAEDYTTFDNYFCSMQGPTWENRLYQLTRHDQVDMTDTCFPTTDAARPCRLRPRSSIACARPDLRATYYYHGEPMTGLFRARYDDIPYRIERFCEDARHGKLAERGVRRSGLHRCRRGRRNVERLSPCGQLAGRRRFRRRRSTTR